MNALKLIVLTSIVISCLNANVAYAQATRNDTKFYQSPSDSSMYNKGVEDAKKYYRKYHKAGTVTLGVSLVGGFMWGAIPAIAYSSTPPDKNNSGDANVELMKNDSYYRGYIAEAKRIKKRKTWTNFAIGAFINTVVLFIIVDHVVTH